MFSFRLAVTFAVFSSVLAVTLPVNSQSPKVQSDYVMPEPCTRALAQHAVCDAANRHALEYMKVNNLTAVTVVQDVRTGALVAFAASDPAQLEVTTSLLPLSVVKLFVAASWWEHKRTDAFVASTANRVSIHEMVVSGGDNAGRLTASELRKTFGADEIIKDLDRFGFPREAGRSPTVREGAVFQRDEKFWSEIASVWRERLTASGSYHSLTASTSDVEWADDLSIGEAGFAVNALSISRFLQAVGNDGVMLPPAARQEMFTSNQPANVVNKNVTRRRMMREPAALKLQAAMRDVVQRGTAKNIAQTLYETGWSIGGKTGSSGPVGPQSDGWFAGLIFDTKQHARFTVATFVRHGGTGGGNAAKLSADLARYLIASVND